MMTVVAHDHWNRHAAIMGCLGHPWQDAECYLQQFDGRAGAGRDACSGFFREQGRPERQPEFPGAGLVLSA